MVGHVCSLKYQTILHPCLQAFRSLTPEGDSKLLDLKAQGGRLCEPPQGSRKLDVQQLVTFTEQQWTSVLQILRQVELRALADDFSAQTKATEAWVREQEQKLEAVGDHVPPGDRDGAAKVCRMQTLSQPKCHNLSQSITNEKLSLTKTRLKRLTKPDLRWLTRLR